MEEEEGEWCTFMCAIRVGGHKWLGLGGLGREEGEKRSEERIFAFLGVRAKPGVCNKHNLILGVILFQLEHSLLEQHPEHFSSHHHPCSP